MRKSYQEFQAGVTLDGQIAKLRERFDQLEDHRVANSSYPLSDILISKCILRDKRISESNSQRYTGDQT